MPRVPLFLLLLQIEASFVYGQKPVISPGGVVNAASYSAPISGGSIVSVFGQNLAQTTQSATSYPLPATLAGTSVNVGGLQVPIFFVSPTQINIQLPLNASYPDLQASGYQIIGSTIVTTPAGVSDPISSIFYALFGVFTVDGSGCGRGQVLNVAADGSISPNGPSNSVSPGQYVAVFGTGLGGPWINPPPDGVPAPLTPLSWFYSGATARFDVGSAQTSSRAYWAGRAPGYIGLEQVNVQVPAGTREGCAVPLTVSGFGGAGASQAVTISVHTGGGSCVDPPSTAYGQITWEKSLDLSSDPAVEADALTAVFPAAPGEKAPTPVAFQEGGGLWNTGNHDPSPSRSCSVPGYRYLDAGTIAARGQGFGPVQANLASINAQTVYQATLPNGAIQPGSFMASGSGGADVGAFQSALQIGSGITVTSSFPPGSFISAYKNLTVNWTGGDPNTWVTVTLLTTGQSAAHNGSGSFKQARTSDGTMTFYGAGFDNYLGTGIGPGEIIIEVTPDPSQTPTLSIPGVSLGTQYTWKYTYRFSGLTFQ